MTKARKQALAKYAAAYAVSMTANGFSAEYIQTATPYAVQMMASEVKNQKDAVAIACINDESAYLIEKAAQRAA